LNSANGNPHMQAVARTLAPKLALHNHAIQLDSALFRRIDALHAGSESGTTDLAGRVHRRSRGPIDPFEPPISLGRLHSLGA